MVDPIETLVVTFFDLPVLAARSPDDRVFLAIRDLCASVGLSRESQMRRLRTDPDLSIGLQTFRIGTTGGPQPQEFLLLEHVPLWISGVTYNAALQTIGDGSHTLKGIANVGMISMAHLSFYYAMFARAGATEAAQQELAAHGGVLVDLPTLYADLGE